MHCIFIYHISLEGHITSAQRIIIIIGGREIPRVTNREDNTLAGYPFHLLNRENCGESVDTLWRSKEEVFVQ